MVNFRSSTKMMGPVVCLSDSVTSQFILPLLLEVRGMAEGSPNWRLAGTRPGGGVARQNVWQG
jgi:hypothetical protein